MNKLAKLGRYGILLVILLVLILCLPQIAHFATDLLWFDELGYQSVFLKFTFAKFAVGFVVFLLVFLLSYATLHLTTSYQPEVKMENDTVINVPDKKAGKRILALVPSLLLGLLAGWLAATVLWQNILLFLQQTPSGVTDPVFGRDISFYFFSLSLFETVYQLAFLFLAVIFLCNLLMTFYLQGFSKKTFQLMGKRIIYFAVAFCVAADRRFSAAGRQPLYAQDGSVFGAGYTDLHVTRPCITSPRQPVCSPQSRCWQA